MSLKLVIGHNLSKFHSFELQEKVEKGKWKVQTIMEESK